MLKNKLNYKLITFFTFIFAIFFIIFSNRQIIYMKIAESLFGKYIYNIDYAQVFYTYADEASENKPMWLNYQLSRINFIKGNLNKAIEYANLELRYHPDNCRSYYIRGLSYGYKEKLDQAISDFEKFNSCIPDTWAGHNDLAWFWFRKGNMNQVINVIDRVKVIYEFNPWLQNTYGTALMNVGRYQEAKKAFENAKLGLTNMTPKDWGVAYPGNDPKIYSTGLQKMKNTIESNIKILAEEINNKNDKI